MTCCHFVQVFCLCVWNSCRISGIVMENTQVPCTTFLALYTMSTSPKECWWGQLCTSQQNAAKIPQHNSTASLRAHQSHHHYQNCTAFFTKCTWSSFPNYHTTEGQAGIIWVWPHWLKVPCLWFKSLFWGSCWSWWDQHEGLCNCLGLAAVVCGIPVFLWTRLWWASWGMHCGWLDVWRVGWHEGWAWVCMCGLAAGECAAWGHATGRMVWWSHEL